MTKQDRFIVGGWRRAHSAAEPEVRKQVFAEYSEQLEAATAWERFWLWHKVEREIKRRVKKMAAPDALY